MPGKRGHSQRAAGLSWETSAMRTSYLTGNRTDPQDRASGKRQIFNRAVIESLVLNVRTLLSIPDNHMRNRLQRFGLGLLSYFACEKVALEYFYSQIPDAKVDDFSMRLHLQRKSTRFGAQFAREVADAAGGVAPVRPRRKTISSVFGRTKNSVADIVRDEPKANDTSVEAILRRAIANFSGNDKMMLVVLYLVGNMFYCSGEDPLWANAIYTEPLIAAVKGMQKSKTDTEYNEALTSVQSLASVRKPIPEVLRPYAHLAPWDFPLDLAGWQDDMYPDGLQSLPADIREKIREGGRFEVCSLVVKREMHQWKSSHDMMCLMFRPESEKKEIMWSNNVPVGRVKAILTTTNCDELRDIAEHEKGQEGQYVTLVCTPCREIPRGLQLHLHFKSAKERDAFCLTLVPWRDGATSGFQM
eukprot:Polyplicarium_translucidae@DN3058_c0_g1_i2.p1